MPRPKPFIIKHFAHRRHTVKLVAPQFHNSGDYFLVWVHRKEHDVPIGTMRRYPEPTFGGDNITATEMKHLLALMEELGWL